MGTYQSTHPWITFKVRTDDIPPRTWVILGECQSKCKHIANVPLRPDTANQLYRIYLAKGALATTAIEGNTLSQDEVLQHLEGKLKLPPSREYLTKEIDNVVGACNEILKSIKENKVPEINVPNISSLNSSILKDLKLEEDVLPGKIRQYSVVVGKYRGAPAKDCEFLLGKLCDWLNGEDFYPAEGLDIAYAILKAIICHLYLAWIHPFGDGNGRTARLLEFQILLSAGIPAASAHLLSNHYNMTRSEYYRQLDLSSKNEKNIIPFITYAIQGFFDGLVEQIDVIWKQQWDITWRNYVHEHFKDKNSITHVRRRHLTLDLSRMKEPIPASKISEISPRITKAYANCTHKTLMRDLNSLVNTGLILKTEKGYRAQKEIILAFLPDRISKESGSKV